MQSIVNVNRLTGEVRRRNKPWPRPQSRHWEGNPNTVGDMRGGVCMIQFTAEAGWGGGVGGWGWGSNHWGAEFSRPANDNNHKWGAITPPHITPHRPLLPKLGYKKTSCAASLSVLSLILVCLLSSQSLHPAVQCRARSRQSVT